MRLEIIEIGIADSRHCETHEQRRNTDVEYRREEIQRKELLLKTYIVTYEKGKEGKRKEEKNVS